MWTYSQSTGELLHNGKFVGTGYSGIGIGRNRPDAQRIRNTGPIPQGLYDIGNARNDPILGKLVMPLIPCAGTECYDRSGFYVHGDDARHEASHGCIVLGPTIRILIASSTDRKLQVIP